MRKPRRDPTKERLGFHPPPAPGRKDQPHQSDALTLSCPLSFLFAFALGQGQRPQRYTRLMQVLYRAPDGNFFFTEEDCLSYEREKPQEYWDKVHAVRALEQARATLNARQRKGPF